MTITCPATTDPCAEEWRYQRRSYAWAVSHAGLGIPHPCVVLPAGFSPHRPCLRPGIYRILRGLLGLIYGQISLCAKATVSTSTFRAAENSHKMTWEPGCGAVFLQVLRSGLLRIDNSRRDYSSPGNLKSNGNPFLPSLCSGG